MNTVLLVCRANNTYAPAKVADDVGGAGVAGVVRLVASLTSYADASLELYVSATDGGGKSSVLNALVDVSLLDSLTNLPQFTHKQHGIHD